MTAVAPAPMTATSAAVAAIKNNAIDDLLGLETELSNLQERDGHGVSKIKDLLNTMHRNARSARSRNTLIISLL